MTRDEQAIREVVTLSFTTDEVEPDCRERLSDAFIERSFKTRERCVRVQADDDDEPAEAVDFAAVDVDGDRATTEIEVRGGDSDGAAGGLQLVRERGAWRIDDVSTPFLRALMEAGLQADGADDDLPPSAKRCFDRFTGDLPDTELRELAYALIGEIEQAMHRAFEALGGCEADDGRSVLREIFEQGLAKGLKEEGADDQLVGCIARALRRRVSDEELSELLASEESRALGSEAAEAARACKMRSESLEPS